MAKLGAWLKEKAPPLHKFLTRRDRPWPILRELLAGVLVIVILIGLLYGLTGQPMSGGYPVVVVTSGSMMHCKDANGDVRPKIADTGKACDPTSYGRIGTIDPGDLVFVRKFSGTDAVTKAEQRGWTYGEYGDVLVYRPHVMGFPRMEGGSLVTPVIHRAVFYVDVHEDGSYTIRGNEGKTLQEMSAIAGCTVDPGRGRALRPEHSGFVTRGDNNGGADQCGSPDGFGYDLVKPDHILGKARGELPWIGLVKLWVDDLTQKSSNFANAGGDSKTMLLVTVVVLIGGPWTLDLVLKRRHRNKMEAAEKEGTTDDAPGEGAEKAEPTKSRRKGKAE